MYSKIDVIKKSNFLNLWCKNKEFFMKKLSVFLNILCLFQLKADEKQLREELSRLLSAIKTHEKRYNDLSEKINYPDQCLMICFPLKSIYKCHLTSLAQIEEKNRHGNQLNSHFLTFIKLRRQLKYLNESNLNSKKR